MKNQRTYRGLRFDRKPRPISKKVITSGVSAIVFSLIWLMLPGSALYWVLMPIIICLVWVATFGWHQALVNFIQFLRNLEDL